jgi:hypothetical protein
MGLLTDVCPYCDNRSAAAPLSIAGDANGSLRAAYRCTRGHQWTCWWDAESAGLPAGAGAAS